MASISFDIQRTFLVAVVYFLMVNCDELQCPNNYTSTTTIRKLRQNIFCKYDRWIRPVRQHNDTVDVSIGMVLQKIDFDEKTDSLTIYSLLTMRWIDYHIIWKPADFDGIDHLRTTSWNVWNPDIGVQNSFDESAYGPYQDFAYCNIYSIGVVFCVPQIRKVANCAANLKYWPYDTHTCNLVFVSWTHWGEELNLTLSPYQFSTHEYNMNREWNLMKMTSHVHITKYDNNTYPMVIFTFFLERHSGTYLATVVVPAILLMLVNLVTYWMDPCQSERLILYVVGVLSHFTFLKHLGNILPSNGNMTPVIVTFYRDSLILTSMALMLTLVIRGLRSSSQPIPLWASGLSSWVLQNRLGQLVVFHSLDPKAVAEASELSGGEGADLMDSSGSSSKSGWITFTTVLDFMFFFITLITYFVLLIGYIP